jgi:hypothetical protein
MAYSLPIKFHFLCAVTQGILGFEVLTATVVRIFFWEITPYCPLKINRRFGGNYRLHFKVEE